MMEKEGYRYCLVSSEKDTIYVQQLEDLISPILDILHSVIINYTCSGCYHCCYYYNTECDGKWLCEFDFSKTLKNDYDLYF